MNQCFPPAMSAMRSPPVRSPPTPTVALSVVDIESHHPAPSAVGSPSGSAPGTSAGTDAAAALLGRSIEAVLSRPPTAAPALGAAPIWFVMATQAEEPSEAERKTCFEERGDFTIVMSP